MGKVSENGYIKLYRKLLQGPIWQSRSAALKIVAITCLLKANHKDNYWGKFIIKRGSFAISQRNFAEECRLSRRTLRDCLTALKDAHFIAIEHAQSFSIISVLNFDAYQSERRPLNRPNTRPETRPEVVLSPPEVGAGGPQTIKEKNIKDVVLVNSVENFVCKNCQNYETEHIDVKGNKSGYCVVLKIALPPFTCASGCQNFFACGAEVSQQ